MIGSPLRGGPHIFGSLGIASQTILPSGIASLEQLGTPREASVIKMVSSTITPSLQSHWKLDEASGNAIDAHGSNTLLDVNTVTSNPGKLGTARQFTAANGELLTTPDVASLSIGSGVLMTLATWVYMDSVPGSGARHNIVAKRTGPSPEYFMGWNNPYFEFCACSAVGNANFTAANSTSFGGPSTGQWYFVVGWYDGVNLNIQINDGPVDSTAYTLDIYDGLGAFAIGGYYDAGGNEFWDGRIDSVSLWKRVLTAAERTALYNAGFGLDYPFPTAVGITSLEQFGVPIVSFSTGLSIQPLGIPSLQNMGTPRIQETVRMSGIPSLELPGTPRLQRRLQPAAVPSLETLGLPKLNRTSTVPGIPSLENTGTPKVNERIFPTGIASLDTEGTPTAKIVKTLQVTGIPSLEAFGTERVNLRVLMSGITSLEALGTSRIRLFVLPGGIVSLQNMGTPTIKQAQVILPAGIASLQNLGTPRLNLRILMAGIASLERFGTEVVSQSGLTRTLFPPGIASLQTMGTPTVQHGAVTIIVPGIVSLQQLGTPNIARQIRVTGITTGELLGVPRLNLRLLMAGITSLETMGTPRMSLRVLISGIQSLQTMGSPTIKLVKTLQVSGIASLERFGTNTTILKGPAYIIPVGIGSAERLGAILVLSGAVLIKGTVTEAIVSPDGTMVVNIQQGSTVSVLGTASRTIIGGLGE